MIHINPGKQKKNESSNLMETRKFKNFSS